MAKVRKIGMSVKNEKYLNTLLRLENVRWIFFNKQTFMPLSGLHTVDEILKKLDIMLSLYDKYQRRGIKNSVRDRLYTIRKQARKAGLDFIDPERKKGTQARHGFGKNIDEIMNNMDKYEHLARIMLRVSDKTRELGNKQLKSLADTRKQRIHIVRPEDVVEQQAQKK